MSRFSFAAVLFVAGGSLLAGAPFGGTVAFAQDKTMTPKITTVDGVKLNATFYPSGKKNAPVVIMVHPIGEGKSSKSAEWKAMAEYLQTKDYAVITFDLRGHGDSTSVDPDIFWGENKKGVLTPAQLWNRKNVKQSKEPDVLDVKDFVKNPMYLPALCNDIAAVRVYLDRENDKGDCNTGNIFVIGADNGATLAAIWINSEWSRFKYTPPANPMFPKTAVVDKRAEGNDITGAVFLTIQNGLDSKRTMKVPGLLKNACYDHAMGAVFIYGSEDTKAENFAKTLEKTLKKDPKNKKYDYIQAFPRTTNLSGVKLLQNGLMTEKEVASWFGNLVDDRGVEWAQRDFLNTHYVWQVGTARLPAHNRKGDKNLIFDTYERFVTP